MQSGFANPLQADLDDERLSTQLARDAVDLLLDRVERLGFGLNRSDIKQLLGLMKLRCVERGQQVRFHQRGRADRVVILVLLGEALIVESASLMGREPVVHGSAGRGDFLGLTDAFLDAPTRTTALVQEDMAVAILPLTQLDELVTTNTMLASVTMRVLLSELAKITRAQSLRAVAMGQVASSMREHIGSEFEATKPVKLETYVLE
jgi:CRP-like cAMP-binding protein